MELTEKIIEISLYEGRSHMSKGGRKRWSRHVLWDDALPGFGLRISPTNRKSFIVSYRAKGRKRTKTLGTADKLSLDEARQRAQELLDSVADATTPPEARGRRIEGVETVAQLADAYLERHLKATVPSWFRDQRLMRIHIKPSIGRAPIAEISQADVANLAGRIGRSFPGDAKRLRKLLDGMFSWAEEQGLRSRRARAGRSASAPTAPRPEAGGESAGRPDEEGTAGGEALPATPVSAEELRASLERTEQQRQQLAERLEEVSATGVEMLAKMNEQAAARAALETELAASRRRLERAEREAAGRPDPETAEREAGNLRQSVEQLLGSLERVRGERDELGERLSRLESRAAEQAKRLAAATRSRNELEDRLREEERKAAIRRVQSRDGDQRRRGLLWLAAGMAGGVLLALLGQSATGRFAGGEAASGRAAPAETATASPADRPVELTTTLPRAAADAEDAEVLGAPDAGPAAVPEQGGAEPDYVAAETVVRGWAAAWSEQRAEDYLASYSQSFAPPDGLGRGEWESRRRDRIQRPEWIRVTLGALSRTVVAADRVRISFVQGYETPTYSDTVVKTLELALEEGEWRIVAEASD